MREGRAKGWSREPRVDLSSKFHLTAMVLIRFGIQQLLGCLLSSHVRDAQFIQHCEEGLVCVFAIGFAPHVQDGAIRDVRLPMRKSR